MKFWTDLFMQSLPIVYPLMLLHLWYVGCIVLILPCSGQKNRKRKRKKIFLQILWFNEGLNAMRNLPRKNLSSWQWMYENIILQVSSTSQFSDHWGSLTARESLYELKRLNFLYLSRKTRIWIFVPLIFSCMLTLIWYMQEEERLRNSVMHDLLYVYPVHPLAAQVAMYYQFYCQLPPHERFVWPIDPNARLVCLISVLHV